MKLIGSKVTAMHGLRRTRGNWILGGLFLAALLAPGMAVAQENWALQAPATKPPNRTSHGLAYDAAAQKTVIFGGETWNSVSLPPPVYGDTWLWSNGNWTAVTPPTSPSARYSFGMAYDPSKGQVLLFGGLASGVFYGDTWAWDGTTWTQMSSSGPPGRTDTAMAYDPVSGKMILFGGRDRNGYHGDTWSWDWSTSTWTQLTPATAPPARSSHQMVYDAARQQVMLFGGSGPIPGAISGITDFSDTWIWTGTNWTQLSPSTVPPARYHFAMSFDPSQSQVIMFGGVVGGNCGADTWAWNGWNWTQLFPATSPGCKENTAMDYDAATGEIILFGGAGNTPADETWLFGSPSAQTSVTINVPSTVQFTFDGVSHTGTSTVNIAPGSYTLAVASPQVGGSGTQLVFQNWSDSGLQLHSVVVGSSPLSITGAFQTQYSLAAVASPAGSGSILPASGYWASGDVLNLSPKANAGYAFSSWGGACAGNAIPCSITMDSPKSVTAFFTGATINVPPGVQFTLNGTSYTGSQTIGLPPGNYTLATTSPQTSGVGAQATFVSWSDAGAISHQITIGNTPVTVAGSFTFQYFLTTSASPGADGSVLPPSGFRNQGASISVTPAANTGFVFTGWTGACSGTGACTVTMSAPKSVAANFGPATTPVTVTVPSGLSFVLNGTTYATTATLGLVPGSYTLSTPSPQSTGAGSQAVFVSWSDAGAITHSIVVGGAQLSITATFKTQYLLTTSASPATEGTVTQTGPGAAGPYYDAGTTVLVQAVPTANFGFDSWGGACAGSSLACFVTMNGPKSVTGFFGSRADWVHLSPAAPTPQLIQTSMVYDDLRLQTVMFGYNSNKRRVETWVWDGAVWTRKSANAGPQPALNFVAISPMAYDSSHGVAIAFVGTAFDAPSTAETWAWNGTMWTQYFPAHQPPARFGHMMAYDAVRKRIVLYGGFSPQGFDLTDTWEWDGAIHDWILRVQNSAPGGEFSTGMTYDAKHQQVVLQGRGGAGSNSTWVWDGNNWTQKFPATHPVAANGAGGMVYDADQQNVVAQILNKSLQLETWVWDGATWTQQHPATQIPGGNGDIQSMAYDAARRNAVAFTEDANTWVYLIPFIKIAPLTSQFFGNTSVFLTAQNQGNVPIDKLTVTSATLAGVASTSYAFTPTVGVGGTAKFLIYLPSGVGPSGTSAVVILQGTYDAASDVGVPWSGFWPVKLP